MKKDNLKQFYKEFPSNPDARVKALKSILEKEGLIDQKALGIAIIAILMSVIGAAYYLKVIRATYFEGNSAVAKFSVDSRLSMIVMVLMVIAIIILGVWPTGLLQICHQALV